MAKNRDWLIFFQGHMKNRGRWESLYGQHRINKSGSSWGTLLFPMNCFCWHLKLSWWDWFQIFRSKTTGRQQKQFIGRESSRVSLSKQWVCSSVDVFSEGVNAISSKKHVKILKWSFLVLFVFSQKRLKTTFFQSLGALLGSWRGPSRAGLTRCILSCAI